MDFSTEFTWTLNGGAKITVDAVAACAQGDDHWECTNLALGFTVSWWEASKAYAALRGIEIERQLIEQHAVDLLIERARESTKDNQADQAGECA